MAHRRKSSRLPSRPDRQDDIRPGEHPVEAPFAIIVGGQPCEPDTDASILYRMEREGAFDDAPWDGEAD